MCNQKSLALWKGRRHKWLNPVGMFLIWLDFSLHTVLSLKYALDNGMEAVEHSGEANMFF